MNEGAPPRRYELCVVFDALRWRVRAGAQMLSISFAPWERVYQKTQRWLTADCFEEMVNDPHSVLRVAQEQ